MNGYEWLFLVLSVNANGEGASYRISDRSYSTAPQETGSCFIRLNVVVKTFWMMTGLFNGETRGLRSSGVTSCLESGALSFVEFFTFKGKHAYKARDRQTKDGATLFGTVILWLEDDRLFEIAATKEGGEPLQDTVIKEFVDSIKFLAKPSK